jgi:hypothetical protein
MMKNIFGLDGSEKYFLCVSVEKNIFWVGR